MYPIQPNNYGRRLSFGRKQLLRTYCFQYVQKRAKNVPTIAVIPTLAISRALSPTLTSQLSAIDLSTELAYAYLTLHSLSNAREAASYKHPLSRPIDQILPYCQGQAEQVKYRQFEKTTKLQKEEKDWRHRTAIASQCKWHAANP